MPHQWQDSLKRLRNVCTVQMCLKLLKPFFSFKVEEHGNGDDNHDAPKDKVGVVVFQFWDIFEVHSVDTGDESKWDENG